MDWNDTPEQAAFRAEVRELIATKLPERYREGAGEWVRDRKSPDPEVRKAANDWLNALGEHGWVAPHWPREFGGAGLGPSELFILRQETTVAGAPPVGGLGVTHIGPTLLIHGSEEQKAHFLPKILAGEIAWAQGSSEPGSGSDLASLQTRAVRDGDHYVVNGQKIWTSFANFADALFVLVRTDPEAAKHRGISMLLIDADSPGLSIRPLIDMSGIHRFNETFFEDVRVPVDRRVGEENRGWYVATTLLDVERSNIAGAIENRKSVRKLVDYVKTEEGKQRSRLGQLSGLRHQIADRYIESDVQFQFSMRIVSMQMAGIVPNHEASMVKLFNSELSQKITRTGTQALGLYAMWWGHNDEADNTYHDPPTPWAPLAGRFTQEYVRAASDTIRGGTSEIQRNIIATRGLGLPRG